MAEINRKRKSDGSKSDVATHSDSFKKSRRLQCDFCNRAFNKSGNKTLKFIIRVSVIQIEVFCKGPFINDVTQEKKSDPNMTDV